MTRYRVKKQLDWRSWVTPKLLEDKPIHRWYVFPHSFTDELVKALIAEWELDSSDTIVDPFAGAGTAILAAKEKGIPAHGFDLSPLSVLATQVKIANYDPQRLKSQWTELSRSIRVCEPNGEQDKYPDLGHSRASWKTPGNASLNQAINRCFVSVTDGKEVPSLALLSDPPPVQSGNCDRRVVELASLVAQPKSIADASAGEQVAAMLEDVTTHCLPRKASWSAFKADGPSDSITGPPSVCRHLLATIPQPP